MRTLADIPLQGNDRRAIERAADILRRNFPVERLLLFGSKARGEQHPESDIDLLVLTTRPLLAAEKARLIEALFDACFYALSAVLLDRSLKFTRHSGVRAALHQNLIKPGHLGPEMGTGYDELFNDRQAGDYGAFVEFDPTLVQERIVFACRFVAEMANLIRHA